MSTADMPSHSRRIDDDRFGELLRRWNRHQDLRFGSATVHELAASRLALDEARSQLRAA